MSYVDGNICKEPRTFLTEGYPSTIFPASGKGKENADMDYLSIFLFILGFSLLAITQMTL